MTDVASSDALDALRAVIGLAGPAVKARDPVNQPMIRHWCDAMEDNDPVYTDPAFAATSLHGRIVAPPTMLDAWNMPGLAPRRSGVDDPMGRTLTALDEAGFTSVVATNSEHEYLRYLHLGDHLTATQTLTDLSGEKQTALGRGHFVTSSTDYRTSDGEPVGRMMFRILKFKPGTGRASSGSGRPGGGEVATPPSVRAPRRERTLPARELALGDALPRCPIPITATLIVAAAIASRDYQDVHHDRELAVLRGSPDIFMNILTTMGLCGRYVSDWAGPEARFRRVAIRLGAPNYPHDTMVMTGRVESIDERGGVAVSVRGSNALGDHVTGTVELELPVAA
jgi:acyl dehydratase